MENQIWLLFFILGVFVLMQLASIARSLQNTAEMAHMMKRLLAHQGIEWATEVEPSAQVKELARNKKTRIAAIKAYREQSGLDLMEAKAVVDALARTHGTA